MECAGRLLHRNRSIKMTPPPGPYSGKNALALVARASAVAFGLIYGNMKLKYLKVLLHELRCCASLSVRSRFIFSGYAF
uniref:ATP synthase subunit e, mitochondrial n=1 Tax=Kalanchoe fedtschenkoi TaxID=63787 RepID=A0A7N0VJQ0_KALFE